MRQNNVNHIQLVYKDTVFDVAGAAVRDNVKKHLHLDTGKVKSGKIFTVLYQLSSEQVRGFAENSLQDQIIHQVYINDYYNNPRFQSYILIAKLPGVTDDEGVSAQKTLCDLLNMPFDYAHQWIYTQDIFYLEKQLADKELKLIAEDLLGNPLINHFEYGRFTGQITYVPQVHIKEESKTELVDIFVDDERLIAISKKLLLAMDLKEMQTLRAYYEDEQVQETRRKAGMPKQPTDCEIEVFAQTWSEHCKHKEFNALIEYKDLDTGEEKRIDSLFKTYIKNSTDIVMKRLAQNGSDWLVKVFDDNAGVVRIDEERLFIWKVETHNSPSALDPYGGALTGIVGVNRDPLGTGVGGGKLLFNTDVLCFGSPYFDGKLLPGQLHPRRIMSGVVKGIEDGGNKSGIPTVNGSIIFDDRFRGKPLVFCGTGAVMPAKYKGRDTWNKEIDPGDRILMAGGRVGKDGIHGATFSSQEIDEHSPRSAVQIGSPITQKNLSDFMEQAVLKGWIKASTDNGAGGLSSSIGELAAIPGGAVIELADVPLKYSGLKPWEIFVSESQERMTFVVEEDFLQPLFEMAADFEVELTDIGYFTDNGILDIFYSGKRIGYFDLEFLHEGVPRKTMQAEWKAPQLDEPKLPSKINHNEILLKLTGSLNICSRESVIRRYDHEVKGKSVIKPHMGKKGDAPQDAAVMRLDFDSFTGLAIANGINPRLGDIDAYEMSANAFDEAVRSIIAVGGRLPNVEKNDGVFWTVNDNFCVPDSLYNEKTNPDGKYKLAQLVRMNEALYDMVTFFNIPMTSGKDSMKNDFIKEGVKISVPPTILYSMVAKMDDVRKTVTAEFKQEGDLVYLVGHTYDELGASEFYDLFDELGVLAPKVRKDEARQVFQKMMQANEQQLIVSAHDISGGGLAVALAESAFGGDFGVDVDLPDAGISEVAALYSESPSRFVVSIAPENKENFEAIMKMDAVLLGKVSKDERMRVRLDVQEIINIGFSELLVSWKKGLVF